MTISDMRTLPGERDACRSCIHCASIFADQENRIWTVCDIRQCIKEKYRGMNDIEYFLRTNNAKLSMSLCRNIIRYIETGHRGPVDDYSPMEYRIDHDFLCYIDKDTRFAFYCPYATIEEMKHVKRAIESENPSLKVTIHSEEYSPYNEDSILVIVRPKELKLTVPLIRGRRS